MPTALTGEGPLLSSAETPEVWDVVFETVADRAPVVPAIIATTTAPLYRIQAPFARHAFERTRSTVGKPNAGTGDEVPYGS